MKKILALLLCVIMCIGFASCDKKDTIDTTKVYEGSIPLGGSLDDLNIEVLSFGSYKEIEPDKEFVFEGTETHIYYDENSVNPYIMTFRWKKDGQTLEEATKEESEVYSDGYYLMEEDSGWNSFKGLPCGYFCTSTTYKDKFYYSDVMIVEDGNDFLEVVIWGATTEVVLGDSGKAIWVPQGYTDMLNAEEIAHGTVFMGSYDKENYLPIIWVAKVDFTYDYFKWFWADYVDPESFFTQEEYENEILPADWSQEFATEYYKRLGAEVVYYNVVEKDGVKAYHTELTSDAWESKDTDITLEIGDSGYLIWTTKKNVNGTPYIGGIIIDSIHDTNRKVYAGSIPLGGNLKEMPTAGDAYGVYEEVDYKEFFEEELNEGVEAHAYISKGSNTPCICTYRWSSNGESLKDFAPKIAALYSDGEYEYFDNYKSRLDIGSDEAVYYCTGYNAKTGYYYVDSLLYVDGNDFVEIDWYAKTEEVEIGNTGVYMWVPTGYTNNVTDEFKQNGIFFSASYEDSYDLPLIGVVELDGTYKQWSYIWKDDDNFEMTEEEFNNFMQITDWTDEVNKAYYNSLNMSVFLSKEDETMGYKYEVNVCMLKDGVTRVDDIYLYMGDDVYEFWLEYPAGDIEFTADPLMNSLHKK